MKEIRIGVIGTGGRGNLVKYAHNPAQKIRVLAGCDIDDEALRAFRQRYGQETGVYSDYRELLNRKDINTVFVCTPDFIMILSNNIHKTKIVSLNNNASLNKRANCHKKTKVSI